MLATDRYIYCVFMCHLSLEKALKGLYVQRLEKDAPRTHALIYLVETIKLKLPKNILSIIEFLHDVSIPTRYPDDLEKLTKVYDKKISRNIVSKTKAALSCLKKHYPN